MPVHDWSKVTAGTSHHFHQAWITALSDAMNDGLLPDGYYAMAEQVAGRPHPDVLALEAEETLYTAKANRIAICHASGDRVVAFIEIVSPGNIRSQVAVNQLVEKLATALQQGRHLLVIDLHPAGKHDPDGLHAAFWGATPGVTDDRPLSLAAYRADVSPTAYFEPIAVGVALPDMPLFLTPDHYINVPLETTYQTAWRGVPDRWKRVIEE